MGNFSCISFSAENVRRRLAISNSSYFCALNNNAKKIVNFLIKRLISRRGCCLLRWKSQVFFFEVAKGYQDLLSLRLQRLCAQDAMDFQIAQGCCWLHWLGKLKYDEVPNGHYSFSYFMASLKRPFYLMANWVRIRLKVIHQHCICRMLIINTTTKS